MALLWFDGFESYANASDMRYVSSSIINHVYVDATAYTRVGDYGRNSSKGLQTEGSGYPVSWYLNNNYTSFIFGVAVKVVSDNNPTVSTSMPLFDFQDGGTSQLKFCVDNTRELRCYRGDNTLLGTTSGFNLQYNMWKFIEIKFTIDDSAGSVVINCNESQILSLSGIDTQNTANAYINEITFRAVYNWLYTDFDDMYFCDLTGSKNNDFLGDVRVDVVRPNGAGSNTDFIPSAGSNYQNVDEVPGPDDDTTYNDGSSVGEKDSYAMSDLEALGTTIFGVKNQITARKTDAGSRETKLLSIVNSSEYLDSDSFELNDTFATKSIVYEDNPDDSNDWEEADINGMEVGIQITV